MTLTVTTGSVAGVPLGQEKTNTLVGQDTLFHGETLLVVSSSNLGDVALKTDDIDGFLKYTLSDVFIMLGDIVKNSTALLPKNYPSKHPNLLFHKMLFSNM